MLQHQNLKREFQKIRWNLLLLLTPVAPHDKTVMSNHSDHRRGAGLKLVPICGRLYGFPSVTEALTLLKSLYCFKNGAPLFFFFFTKEQMCFLFFFWWCLFGVDLIQVCFFLLLGINQSALLVFSTWIKTLRGWLKLLTKWFVQTLLCIAFSEKNIIPWDA